MHMKGFVTNIEQETLENEDFRRVLYTGKHSQLVLMSLPVGEEIGEEVHEDGDQFVRVEEGEGIAVIDGVEHPLGDGTALVVPAGARHNVKNVSKSDALRLYTLYAPPHHKDGIVRATKEEAEANEEAVDGVTTEYPLP